MPSSVSWQRYDAQHNVSAILTDAARACVVANPDDVTDYLARYFREVAGGTSLKHLSFNEVVGDNAGAALSFGLELCTGPEVSITTSDFTTPVNNAVHPPREAPVSSEESEEADDAVDASYDVVLRAVRKSLIPQLTGLGNVDPQSAWDAVLTSTWCLNAPAPAVFVQWSLSLLAALATAKQRQLPLYQCLGALADVHAKRLLEAGGGAPLGLQKGPATATKNQSTFVQWDNGVASNSRPFSLPQLLVTFVVSDAKPDAPDTAGNCRLSRIYVALDPLTSSLAPDGTLTEAVANTDGALLRHRMQQLHAAANMFVTSNPTAHAGPDGIVHWTGAANLVDVVRAATEALESAGLRVGMDVCVGLSFGAAQAHVQNSRDGLHSAAPTSGAGSAGSNNKKASTVAADTSELYNYFYGEPAVTGEQWTEYLKEQLEEMGTNAVQFLEDTHVSTDAVARQRLQLALQDTVVLSGHTVFDSVDATGSNYADHLTAHANDGVFPNAVADVARCGTLNAAVQLLCTFTASATARTSVTALVGRSAGDAPAAAHVVDVAVASGAPYLLTSTGPFSAFTMSVVTRLAAIMTELVRHQAVAPRPSFRRYNRTDIASLPEVEVAPIRRKGDKKKKDTRKASTKKK